jgi:hypothetical protein
VHPVASSTAATAPRAWLASRGRSLSVLAALALVVVAPRAAAVRAPDASRAAIASALAARGLVCEPEDVVWIDAPVGLGAALRGGARAIARAGVVGEPRDLYLVAARLSPEGAVLSVGGTWNLTDTSGVDESRPLVHDRLAVYTTAADGVVIGVHVLDLAGSGADTSAGFSRTQRAQAALTNLQQTGQTAGVAHTAFIFDPIARAASVSWRADGIVEAIPDSHRVLIDPARATVLQGDAFVRVVPDERARPGNLVTWAVDRVRAMSWFGDDRMQWIKAVTFTVADRVRSLVSNRTTVDDVRTELGIATPVGAPTATFTDPEVGWPPEPLKPAVTPALPGEGRWIALDGDPFITPSTGGGAPAFVTTYLRPDPHRQDERVYVTLWDPRQIELHIEAGVVEPISATGEHGPGLVPRTPEVMNHFVAAFNGGFQAQHGEYGMQANGIEYLPPKPYAATVVSLRDGSNAFGAWPDSGLVPDDVVALRQNLTALVQNGRFNPWGRTWWGGTPPGWPDQVHSTRSAICLTREGFIGYFYSTTISAEDLAEGMLLARCSFGIHLDMNPGHAGFEFYDVAPEGHLLPLGRRLQPEWEAEGKVADMAGYVFRGRRMIRGMGHMLFPRYIQREARDFFYLTTRAILPGAPLRTAAASPQPGEGAWHTKGLPQHGFPYALATTWVRPSVRRPELRVNVLRADPRALAPAAGPAHGEPGGAAAADDGTVLAFAAPARGSSVLWWSDETFAIAPDAPAPHALPLAAGYPLEDRRAAGVRAAAGVQDDDGMLVWVELPADVPSDAEGVAALSAALERAGCSVRIGVPGEAHVALGGTLDINGGATARPDAATARLVRGRAPDGRAIFPDTPIVPIQVWQPLQAKRVRYFYKPATSASSTATPPAPMAHEGPSRSSH